MALTLTTSWQQLGNTITYKPSSSYTSGSLTFKTYVRYQDVSGSPTQKDIQMYTYVLSPGYYRLKNDTIYQTVAGTTKHDKSYIFKSPSSIYYPLNDSDISTYMNTYRVTYNTSTGKWSGSASCYINFTWTTEGGEVQGCYTYNSSDARRGFSGNTSEMSDTISLPDLTRVTITVQANPTYGGTVTGGGTVWSGSSVTVTATPNALYDFINWTKGSTAVSTNSSYTFSPTANTTLVANFESNSDIFRWYIISG